MRHSKWLWCSNAPKIISEYSFSKMTKNYPSSTYCDKPAYIPNSKYSQKQFPTLLALKWNIPNDSTIFQSQEKALTIPRKYFLPKNNQKWPYLHLLWHFACFLDMFFKSKFLINSNSKIFDLIFIFNYFVIYYVIPFYGFSFVCNHHFDAFKSVETHSPFSCPIFNILNISL